MYIASIKNLLTRGELAIKRMIDAAVSRSSIYASYLSTLFYLEIIYLMIVILFALGPIPAVAAGIALTALYSAHLIRLYFRRNVHRIVQLGIMEFHCAFALGFLYNIIIQGSGNNPMMILVAIVRAVLVIMEIPLILLLTSERTIAQYD